MIVDPTELTPFSDFAGTGIITTDTFNDWRKKDNGLVQQFNLFSANSAATGISFDNATATISIKTGGVITTNLADSAVTGDKMANLTITEGKLASNSVTESKLGALAVTEGKIGGLAVTESKLGALAVTEGKIGGLAVTESKIGPLAVTEGKLGALAVTSDKIATSAVIQSKIGAAAVSADKIATNAVTTDKIATSAVIQSKIANSAVTGEKIANLTITGDKIADFTINDIHIASQAISGQKLTGNQTGDAPVFGARAWVRLEPHTSAWARNEVYKSGTFAGVGGANSITFTITATDHRLKVGHAIFMKSSVSGFPDKLYFVTNVLSADQFQVATGAITTPASGTCTLMFVKILGSGNVATASRIYESDTYSNYYVLNFELPMPTAQYAVMCANSRGVSYGVWEDYGYEHHAVNGLPTPGAGNALNVNSCYVSNYAYTRFASFVVFA